MSDIAADKMAKRLAGIDFDAISPELRKEIIDYAYAVVNKYGEGSSSLVCEYYDALSDLSDVYVPPAVPAEPDYGDIAKAVNGTLKHRNIDLVANAIGRQVKLVGVDTLAKNAIRDGAEWAWIPSGDTCAFCIMLASRGWQRASKKALRHGHAEHVHANCDCTYAVRFDSNTDVEGYDPQKYLDMYYGKTLDQDIVEAVDDKYGYSSPETRLIAMRRQLERNNGKMRAPSR